jgi:hypothetical protein
VEKNFFDEALLKWIDWRDRAQAARQSVLGASAAADAVRQINVLLGELKTSHPALYTNWLKAKPDRALEGTYGIGTTPHLAGIFLQNETGVRAEFVHYRGGAMQDLVGGRIDLLIDLPPSALPQLHAGTVKAFAVTGRNRLAAAPEIPTVDEAGVPGLYVSFWHALYAPKGTPKAAIAKLNAAVVEALADPTVRRRLADLVKKFRRASSRHRRRSARCSAPRPRTGGRSSKRLALRLND